MTQGVPTLTAPNPAMLLVALGTCQLMQSGRPGLDMRHEKNTLAFHSTGWLMGIPISFLQFLY